MVEVGFVGFEMVVFDRLRAFATGPRSALVGWIAVIVRMGLRRANPINFELSEECSFSL